MIFSIPPKLIPIIFKNVDITIPKHLAYVEWYSAFKDYPENYTSLYKITPLKDRNGRHVCSVISVANIRRSVHLLPKFGPVAPQEWTSSNVLDCQDGSVGASAVLYYPQNGTLVNPTRTLRCCLGYLIWDAEAAGALMALWMLKGSNRISRLPISIYSDSQALLKSLIAQRASPGFHLVKEITDMVDTLVLRADTVNHPCRIKLQWIAAHKDVKGNEKADEEAKRAAAGKSSPVEHLPHILRKPLPPSLGVIKHQFLIRLREEWVAAWSRSPRKARVEKLDEDFPFEKHRKMIEQLTRIQSSLIFQIRSNHLPLNCYLHRIGKVLFKRCEQCWQRRRVDSPETVTHFLFECPSFERERHDLDAALGVSSRDLKTILSDLDKSRLLLRYIGKTKRFKDLGDVSLMKNTP